MVLELVKQNVSFKIRKHDYQKIIWPNWVIDFD